MLITNRRRFLLLMTSAPLLAQTPATPPELDWHDAKKLTVEGLGFSDMKSPYDRLPSRAENVVRQAVWDLSRDSSGVLVRFAANTTAIPPPATESAPHSAAPPISC